LIYFWNWLSDKGNSTGIQAITGVLTFFVVGILSAVNTRMIYHQHKEKKELKLKFTLVIGQIIFEKADSLKSFLVFEKKSDILKISTMNLDKRVSDELILEYIDSKLVHWIDLTWVDLEKLKFKVNAFIRENKSADEIFENVKDDVHIIDQNLREIRDHIPVYKKQMKYLTKNL
jgi:hypothetical protein